MKQKIDINLLDVREIKTVDTYEDANELLKLGWKLIDISKHELKQKDGSIITVVDYELVRLGDYH